VIPFPGRAIPDIRSVTFVVFHLASKTRLDTLGVWTQKSGLDVLIPLQSWIFIGIGQAIGSCGYSLAPAAVAFTSSRRLIVWLSRSLNGLLMEPQAALIWI
jgi:hypothetical protein